MRRRSWSFRTTFQLPRAAVVRREPNPFADLYGKGVLPWFATRRAALAAALDHFAFRKRPLWLGDVGSVQRQCSALEPGWRPAVQVASVPDAVVLGEYARCGSLLLATNLEDVQRARSARASDVLYSPALVDREFVAVLGAAEPAGSSPRAHGVAYRKDPAEPLAELAARTRLQAPADARFVVVHLAEPVPAGALSLMYKFFPRELYPSVQFACVLGAPVGQLVAQVVGRRPPDARTPYARYYLNGAPTTQRIPGPQLSGVPRSVLLRTERSEDAVFFGPTRAASGWIAVGRSSVLRNGEWVLFGEPVVAPAVSDGYLLYVYFKSLDLGPSFF
jgi:hypothetical protein